MKKWHQWSLISAGLLAMVGITIACWLYHEWYPSTDNAYVKANIVVISAQQSGIISKVEVQDHQAVKEGQLLFSVNSWPLEITAALAKANLEALQKKPQKSVSETQLKQAKEANLQAQLALMGTKIYAPVNGMVENINLHVGSLITTATPALAIVDTSQWWVDANFKENQLARIKPNQPVQVYLDLYGHHPFMGVVVSLASASGNSFALFPAENATGNWVKVPQRFAVRIRLMPDEHYPFRTGASATVTIDTRSTVKTQ